MPRFGKAKITTYYASEGLQPTTKTITNPEEVNRLASFFSGLGEGRFSWFAAGWKVHGRIEFFRRNKEVVIVKFDDFGLWSEGHGDWWLADDFKPYFLKLMKDAEQAAEKGEQTPADPTPGDK